MTEEVISQIKGYDLTMSTSDDKDALMTLENKITQAILPVRAKLMSKLVPLTNPSRAATGQGIPCGGVNHVTNSVVVSHPDLPEQPVCNFYDGHDSDTTTTSLDLAHHRKASCPSPNSVLGHGPAITTTAASSSSSFMPTTAVKQEGYHDHMDQGQGQGQGQGQYSSLAGKKRRSDADLVALVLELTGSGGGGDCDCCEQLPSPGMDMGDPSLFPTPAHHNFSHSHSHSSDNLCYMDMFDHAGGGGACIDPSPLPMVHPSSFRPMPCQPSVAVAPSSSSSSSSMFGGMMGGSASSSSMHHHHSNINTSNGGNGFDLGAGSIGGHVTGGGGGGGGQVEYMSSRRRRRLNLIVPNPRKPRPADYTCSLCTEDYQVHVDQNPWWAVYSHECPKCKQLQIPRIDISLGNNAIELDPNVIALYGEGVEDSCDDGEDDDSEGEEDDVGGGGGPGGDNEGGGNPSELDQEELKRDVHPFDGEGLLAAEEASKLLVLMCHARSCTGAHASPKHAEICKSTKFLMLHIRDCNGIDVRGRGDCQFPWCQPCKRMLRHLTHCYDPANCVVCNPWTLPESFQQLRSLNNRSLALQQAAAQQQRQAAAAAAAASQPSLTMGQQPPNHQQHQHQQPMMMMMNPMSVGNLVMPPEW